MEKIKLSFEISEEAFNLLKKINKSGCAEYRDTEWNTLEDFKKSDTFIEGIRSEEWFLNRNFGGTGYLLDELLNHNLVESDGMIWHITYLVSAFGKEILKRCSDI